MALRALVSVASLTDPRSVIRSRYISDLSSSFRMLSLDNVTLAFVDATALLDQKKSLATEKLFDSESSDATTTLLRNVVKLVATLLPITDDDLPNRILSGTVSVKPNMQGFRGSCVVFEDGTVEDDIDLVVFATGYTFSFPFLSSHVIPVSKNKVSLYKYVYPPGLEQPTLAVIGLIQPLGPIMPISEMQARWTTRVFKGLCKLPPMSAMMKDIKAKKEAMAQRYVAAQRHTIQVAYIPYMDELAKQVGDSPPILKLLLTEPRLALNVIFGPCTLYQFWLHGPGQWEGARQAILIESTSP